ncbi:MAG TPA: endonuclease V [Nannocystis sp.]|jgi:deoxyribonuclease V
MTTLPLLACVDVDYRGAGAVAAAILFLDWSTPHALAEHVVAVDRVAPYRPGAFYERELPCIMAVLARSTWPIATIVVDGHVWLGPEEPGLGAHLYLALGGHIPVVGVAKSPYRGAPAAELLRGDSQRPLYVTAAGVDPEIAADNIRRMHGPHRLPTLLKAVDSLCRRG